MSTKHRRKPYMPDSDHGKAVWMERFLRQLESDPKHYGFDDERMFEFTQRTIRNFIDAARAAGNKAQRSPNAVSVKNRSRAEAVAMCRSIAMRLKVDPTLSDAEKRSLGIRTDAAAPEEAMLPQGVMGGTAGSPLLNVQSSPNGGHVIRYRDSTTPSKAKPKGVSHLLLFAAIGEKPYMRRTHARLLGAYTKRPFEIMYPIGCGIEGLYVTYFGRWLTTRGEMSPWSQGVSKIIGAAQVSLCDSEFGHMFEKEGFIDALPQSIAPGVAPGLAPGLAPGIAPGVAEDRPLLESAESGRNGLFGALDAEIDAKMLPWHTFALLETEIPGVTARAEDTG